MVFTPVNRETWAREEYFEHYFSAQPCTYSMCVKLDITPIIEKDQRLYPAMLYNITTIVNRHEAFRYAINAAGILGTYDELLPCYTVFHKDIHTFSNIWTAFCQDYDAFCAAYEADLAAYGDKPGFMAKPGLPENHFNVSMIPWTTFEGFNLNLEKGYTYLLPIFTLGRYVETDGKYLLPLALQVHHAICDGYHACQFIHDLQALIAR